MGGRCGSLLAAAYLIALLCHLIAAAASSAASISGMSGVFEP